MTYFVIADTHGFYTKTKEALAAAGFFAHTGEKKLILCGDALDRGEEAEQMAAFLLEEKEKGELIYITGNHEDLLYQALQEIARGNALNIACGSSHHYTNGTWDTLLQLAHMTAREAVDQPHALTAAVRASDFYRKLLPGTVDYFETEHYIFCHGWIPVGIGGYISHRTYEYLPDWRSSSIELWQKARWLNGMDMSCRYHLNEPEKTVVCGHWHASYGHATFGQKTPEWGEKSDHSPFYAEGIIALDACTAVSGRVNCIVIED